ncbi:hypothetical protein GGF37_005039, partial [Kickxella alabastrina]
PIESVEQQVQQMQQIRQQTGAANIGSNSMALVPSDGGANGSLPLQTAKQFAERTLQSLFDYAMSFATRPDSTMGMFGSGAAVQVLPVKVFEEWYNNFSRKVQRDPAVAM